NSSRLRSWGRLPTCRMKRQVGNLPHERKRQDRASPMIEILNPWYFFGLLAAGIPLLVHLSRSRKTKKMRFSTTRFFTDQFLRSYRMSRLKELLLLACRMALCAVLATALARPLFLSKGPAIFGGSRSIVLVIDNSASMGYSEEGVTMLDR